MRVIELEQGTPEWLAARLGKVTGTRLAGVMGTKVARDSLINELIAEQLTEQYEEVPQNSHMIRGNEEEPFAIKAYEKKYKCRTKEVGMCVSDDFDWLALSPDRLRMRGKKYVRGVEVKSPMTKTVVKYLRAGGIPKEYYWQVINYLLVCDDLTAVDFIVHDPRIKVPDLQLTRIEVKRSDVHDDVERCREALPGFKAEWDAAYEQLIF